MEPDMPITPIPHNYVTSTRKMYVDNQAWNAADPTLSGPWDGLVGEYGVTWRDHFPGYATDTAADAATRDH